MLSTYSFNFHVLNKAYIIISVLILPLRITKTLNYFLNIKLNSLWLKTKRENKRFKNVDEYFCSNSSRLFTTVWYYNAVSLNTTKNQ